MTGMGCNAKAMEEEDHESWVHLGTMGRRIAGAAHRMEGTGGRER